MTNTSSRKEHPIRRYRKAQRLRPSELAERLGIPESTLRSYENRTRKYPPEFAVKFEQETGVPRQELLPELFAV